MDESLRQAVNALLAKNATQAINTLKIYFTNVLKTPSDIKYRKIGVLNKPFNERVVSVPEALSVLTKIGWKIDGEFYILPILQGQEHRTQISNLEQVKTLLSTPSSTSQLPELFTAAPQSQSQFQSELPALFAPSPSATSIPPSSLSDPFDFQNTAQSLGFTLSIPSSWTNVPSPNTTAKVYKTSTNVIVIMILSIQKVSLHPSLLNTYRHELRLIAAAHRGGLVSCDLHPEGFVSGIIKQAQPTTISNTGLSYELHLLIPSKKGHLQITCFADEGVPSGLKEALLVGQLCPNEGSENNWFSDPYGFIFPNKKFIPIKNGATVEVQRAKEIIEISDPDLLKAIKISLGLVREDDMEEDEDLSDAGFYDPWQIDFPYSKADEVEHDKTFATHPLARTRSILGEFFGIIKVDKEWIKESENNWFPEKLNLSKNNIKVKIPIGFSDLNAPSMDNGHVFSRGTFQNEFIMFTVTLQPHFPDCGRSIEVARQMAQKHIEWGKLGVMYGPIIKKKVIGLKSGILNRLEGILLEKPILSLSFYVPYGDSSCEIGVTVQRGNMEVGKQLLHDLVVSLEF